MGTVALAAGAPGWCVTDRSGYQIFRTAAHRAATAVRLATLDADGPSGPFFNYRGPVPWRPGPGGVAKSGLDSGPDALVAAGHPDQPVRFGTGDEAVHGQLAGQRVDHGRATGLRPGQPVPGPLDDGVEMRFVNVAEWDSPTVYERAWSNPDWRASMRRTRPSTPPHGRRCVRWHRGASPIVCQAMIREYREADEADVVELSLRAWAPVFASLERVLGSELFDRLHGDWRAYQADSVRATLADPGTRAWVAEAGPGVAGFVTAALHRERRLGEISMLAVDPDHQRRGVGAALTGHVSDWLRDAGMQVAMVETGGDMGHAAARRVYEAAGYTLLPVARYFKVL